VPSRLVLERRSIERWGAFFGAPDRSSEGRIGDQSPHSAGIRLSLRSVLPHPPDRALTHAILHCVLWLPDQVLLAWLAQVFGDAASLSRISSLSKMVSAHRTADVQAELTKAAALIDVQDLLQRLVSEDVTFLGPAVGGLQPDAVEGFAVVDGAVVRACCPPSHLTL
jgi:hypothetical protein